MSFNLRRMGIGALRPSQLMHSFGVGAVVDLPNLSVLVMGLDRWDKQQCRELIEERLLRKVQLELGPQVESLRLPPMPAQDSPQLTQPLELTKELGVPVALFPRYMKCPACSFLAPVNCGVFTFKPDLHRMERTRIEHSSCAKSPKKAPLVVPARFLVVCEAGHMDDFPWVEFVHQRKPCTTHTPVLHIFDGLSGEPSEVRVECECGAKRVMGEALGDTGREDMPQCRGRRPHLADYEEGGCSLKMKTMLLGASNSWFTESESVLSLPVSVDPLRQLVEQHWAELQHVTAQNILGYLRATGKLTAFSQVSDDALWQAIEQRRSGVRDEADDPRDLLAPEWRLFDHPDLKLNSSDFELEPVKPPDGFEPWLSEVVLVRRLREVSAMLGFSRVDAPDFSLSASPSGISRAVISRKPPSFVPAVEVRGEGIFLKFREKQIDAWLGRNGDWENAFMEAHIAWRRQRKLEPEAAGFPGLRYILLHSLSHALMRQVALECGYMAASIAERIYAREEGSPGGPMAGILLYTSAPDSEGTLGGLVSLGEPQRLGPHLEQALEQMRLCASDPLCAEHHPHLEGVSLHGAACHACLFAPETSCERGNRYLDRGVLVETLARQVEPFFRR